MLRVDLNVPIHNNEITDTTRIIKIIPTVTKLLEHKAKIILVSHLGRPKGVLSNELSLKCVKNDLETFIKKKIFFCETNTKSIKKEDLEEKFKEYEIILLENIRFNIEEEKNEEKFVKKLSSLAEIYINECFSCSHRNHASISGIPKFLPSFPGQLLEDEISNLKNLFYASNHSNSIAVFGGAKISTKIKLIEFYAEKFTKILIGGAMANTFLLSEGNEIGLSMHEKKMVKFSKEMTNRFKEKILLPLDFIVTNTTETETSIVRSKNKIKKKDTILDIGPQTRMLFYNEIFNSDTVLWNGPLGLFEKKPFNAGTEFVLKAIRDNKNKKFFSVAGGGDTIALLNQSDFFKNFTFVSTGGGAFLEFVQGAHMPGLASLND
ncbi:MAG: phosphoglycerate kinase [Pseudomonadota bacterium]|nr:phosphoglycerate kinase [Pseudomonadota bacterium]